MLDAKPCPWEQWPRIVVQGVQSVTDTAGQFVSSLKKAGQCSVSVISTHCAASLGVVRVPAYLRLLFAYLSMLLREKQGLTLGRTACVARAPYKLSVCYVVHELNPYCLQCSIQ